jgi:hypothetical protein
VVGRGGGRTEGLRVWNSSSQYNYSECIYKKAKSEFFFLYIVENLFFYLREEGINNTYNYSSDDDVE